MRSERQIGRLAWNALANFLGLAVPLVAGIFAIPILISALGTARFGVLTLAWMAVGYFSFFDMGLGRALTKLVAERIGTDQERDVASLAWTALALMLAFGLLGAAIGLALAPWFAGSLLQIPAGMRDEAARAFSLLALSLPIVITSVGLRSLLEARHRFALVNAIRIPTGAFTFLGPLAVLPFASGLEAIVGVLVMGRVLAWGAHALACARVLPLFQQRPRPEWRLARQLLGLGGWMTVSNIVGPLMVYMDRLLIGALISAAAVAYYATPYEVITRMWLVPGALLGVLFPAFAAGLHDDPHWVSRTFRRAVHGLLLALLPVTALMVLYAQEGLALWLGPEFAARSATVARWLAIGVFINSIAQVPYTLIQGGGRADLTGKLHLAELPLYGLALWWLTLEYGIVGAAIAWTFRAGLDAVLLFLVAPQFLPRGVPILRDTIGAATLAVVALTAAAFVGAPPLKVGSLILILCGTGVLAWRIFSADYRTAVARYASEARQ